MRNLPKFRLSTRTWQMVGLGFVLLLAVVLRFYQLDVQSFWSDEGNAISAARRSIPLVIKAAQGDIHPPGYYLLLHFWWLLAGESEFAIRALGVFFSVLTVALTFNLGRRLLGTPSGLGGALLIALSPLAIYYAQEARMYALLGFLSVASSYSFCRMYLVPRSSSFPSLLPSLAYLFTSAAGLYTHYSFPIVLAAHNLLFVVWWVVWGRRKQDRWRLFVKWGIVQVLVLFCFLPWLPSAIHSLTAWPSIEETHTLGQSLLDIFRALVVGITLEASEAKGILIAAGGLFLLGLLPGIRKGKGINALVIWLLLPILLLFVLGLYKPGYVKFLLAVLSPFYLLLAHGVYRFSRLAARPSPLAMLLTLILGTVLSFASLRNLYFDPTYARDDYRQVAADLSTMKRPTDAVLLNAPNQWEVLHYYLGESIPLHPAPYHPTPETAAAWLEPLRSAHQRLIVVYWGDRESDPGRQIEMWLANHTYQAYNRWYGRVRLTIYGIGPLPEEPTIDLDARLGQDIHLLGYTMGQGTFQPGDVVPLTLFWNVDAPVPDRYKVFLHLLDEQGSLVAQNDCEPIGNLIPTTFWRPEETVIDRHGILLPADLPPGTYTLTTGLYHLYTAERLPITQVTDALNGILNLGTVTVSP